MDKKLGGLKKTRNKYVKCYRRYNGHNHGTGSISRRRIHCRPTATERHHIFLNNAIVFHCRNVHDRKVNIG